MSYVVRILIACDEPGCRQTISFQRDNRGGLSKTWAAHAASTNGWYVRSRGLGDPKVAYCPVHLPELRA